MIIRSLIDGEQDACLDLWDVAFEGAPRAYFERYFQDPHWHLQDTVVCEEEGRLVSAVHVVRRVVETRQGRRNMAGIANVSTHPDFRGGGRSTACLTETIARMGADPTLDFSLLGTGIPDFYARLGWKPWKLCTWEGGNPLLETQSVQGQSRPATPLDLPQIAAWHEAQNRNQPLAVVRDIDYWQHWMHWTPEDYLVCEKGYARVQEDKGVRVVLACTEGFPWQEAFGTAPRVRLCLPLSEEMARKLLVDPIPAFGGGWMIGTLQNKDLPDLTDACYYDGDGF
jgi:predicted N-acetyltransferase YhbS